MMSMQLCEAFSVHIFDSISIAEEISSGNARNLAKLSSSTTGILARWPIFPPLQQSCSADARAVLCVCTCTYALAFGVFVHITAFLRCAGYLGPP